MSFLIGIGEFKGNIMSGIRLADIPDIKHIYKLGLELISDGAYKGIKHDEQKFKTTVAGLIGSKLGRVYVVVDDADIPQGFFLGIVDDLFFSRYRYATDMAVFIRKGFRQYAYRLYKLFIEWAKTKPRLFEISFAQSSGMGDHLKWCKLMERLGLERNGSFYTMRCM